MSLGSINLFYEEVDFVYPTPEKAKAWILQSIKDEQFELSYLNIVFCSDAYLLKINQDYLSHDYYTDIITFQYDDQPIEGELFISIDRVTENAQEHGIPFEHELSRVIIHGVLHLMGYKDKAEKDIELMRAKEDHYVRNITKAY